MITALVILLVFAFITLPLYENNRHELQVRLKDPRHERNHWRKLYDEQTAYMQGLLKEIQKLRHDNGKLLQALGARDKDVSDLYRKLDHVRQEAPRFIRAQLEAAGIVPVTDFVRRLTPTDAFGDHIDRGLDEAAHRAQKPQDASPDAAAQRKAKFSRMIDRKLGRGQCTAV